MRCQMTDVLIKFSGSHPVPEYKSSGSSGADICAAESAFIAPGQFKVVPTGLYVQLPSGYEGQVRSRSGLAANHGLWVLNSPGTIDSDYRGEIKIILANTGMDTYRLTKGERIAQLIIAPVSRASFTKVESLDETVRGTGGFGSTGKLPRLPSLVGVNVHG